MASDMDTTAQKVMVRRLDLQGHFFRTSWLNKVHGIHLCTRAGGCFRVAAVVSLVSFWLAFSVYSGCFKARMPMPTP